MNDRTVFNYNKLNGRIVERCGTSSNFAKLLGCSNNTMSLKMNNKSEFSQNEIIKSIKILDLKKEDIPTYFFTQKV